jgi:hypothetical protein
MYVFTSLHFTSSQHDSTTAGVEADDRLQRFVAKIGGTIIADLADMAGVTHVVTDGSLKRTPKLLVALNLGACYVVGVKWLEDSAKQTPPHPLPISLQPGSAPSVVSPTPKKGRGKGGRGASVSSYLVQDREKEKKWAPFTLVDTLRHNYQRATGGLFAGMGIFIASDVFGRQAPSREEMRLIVESGGGSCWYVLMILYYVYMYYVLVSICPCFYLSLFLSFILFLFLFYTRLLGRCVVTGSHVYISLFNYLSCY